MAKFFEFQPTPSARRVTRAKHREIHSRPISTHTLRKEGDDGDEYIAAFGNPISTHTLRKEGDYTLERLERYAEGFQPTPSARRVTFNFSQNVFGYIFQPTPSARRVTTL